MIPTDSEIGWLVYADWLEDHDQDATHIREEIQTPPFNVYGGNGRSVGGSGDDDWVGDDDDWVGGAGWTIYAESIGDHVGNGANFGVGGGGITLPGEAVGQ